MDLSIFNEQRRKIQEIFEELLEVSNKVDAKDISEGIVQATQNIRYDKFNIVVVGEFSRGKSTFINALLGERVLPSSTKPTTTVISKISAGDRKEYSIHYRGKNKVDILEETDFINLVAKIHPPNEEDDRKKVKEYEKHIKYISSISYADIKYPSKVLIDGVEIIDTPGTNDCDQVREEITFSFLPKADAAIIILAAHQILSESEVDFLNERILANSIDNIFFVINHKDKLHSEEDEEKVLNYAKDHLVPRVNVPKIFMVSSRAALNYKRMKNGEVFKGKTPENYEVTGFKDFESNLSDFLNNERGKAKINKYNNLGLKFANNLLVNNIEFELSYVDSSVLEVERKLIELQPKIKESQAEIKKIIKQLKKRVKDHKLELERIYKSGLKKIAIEAGIVVTKYQGELDPDLIFREVEKNISSLQINLSKEIEEYKVSYIEPEFIEFEKKIALIVNRLRTSATNKKISVKADLSVKSEENRVLGVENVGFSLATGDVFLSVGALGTVALTSLAGLTFVVALPVALVGAAVFSHYYGTMKKEKLKSDIKKAIDERYGRPITAQVNEFKRNFDFVVNEFLLKMEEHANNEIIGLENQLSNLISEKNDEMISVEKKRTQLLEYKLQTQKIIYQLESEKQ